MPLLRVIGGDDHRAAKIVPGAVTGSAHVAQAENRSRYRRRAGKSPRLTAIARGRGSRIIGIAGIQITAAYDAVKRITEINCKRSRARRLIKGVSYAFQVLPSSLVASTLAMPDPPVQIQAFLPP